MDRDSIGMSLLHLLALRWTACGRTGQPENATFPEIADGLAEHLSFDRRQLRSVLTDLVTASLIDAVTVEHRGAEAVAYRISDAVVTW